MPADKHSREVRRLALLSRTGEYPIPGLVVSGCEPPFPKHFRQKRVECDGLLRCLTLAATDNAIHDGAANIDFQFLEIYVLPLERKQLAYAQACGGIEESHRATRFAEICENLHDLLHREHGVRHFACGRLTHVADRICVRVA